MKKTLSISLLISILLLVGIVVLLQNVLFKRTFKMGADGCMEKTIPASDNERADANKDGCTTKEEYDEYIRTISEND